MAVPPMNKTYTTVFYLNSKRAIIQGLTVGRDRFYNLCHRDVQSAQVFRDDDGGPLPRCITSQLYRAWRSKYKRHVGRKQLAKIAVRGHVSA